MNRQRLILFVLVILLGGTLIWSYSAMPRPKTVASPAARPAQKGSKPSAPAQESDDGTRVKIDLLDRETGGFKGYRRNIFKPVFVDELKQVKQKAVAVKPPPPPPPPPKVVVPVVEPEESKPQPAPLARFTFVGFLKTAHSRTIFLSKDKEIVLVKQGDKIAGRYEATEINDQSLILTVSDTGDQIVIPLVENRPLTAAR